MQTMTREDVLEVLELLPMWQLRAPLQDLQMQDAQTSPILLPLVVPILAVPMPEDPAHAVPVESIPAQALLVDAVDKKALDTSVPNPIVIDGTHSVCENALSVPAQTSKNALEDVASLIVECLCVEDFIFVLNALPRGDAANTLLKNMLRAMRLTMPNAMSMRLSDVMQLSQPIIISMGESESQALLQNSKSLNLLRGEVHAFGNKRLITTLDSAFLLEHPQEKPKAWADLCLAMQARQALKSA